MAATKKKQKSAPVLATNKPPGLRLHLRDEAGNTTVVPMTRKAVTIGRHESNTIRLPHRDVSRRHARVFHKDSCLYMEDLASYNGSKVNGQRIGGPTAVGPGDRIEIGGYLLWLEAEEDSNVDAPTLRIEKRD